MDVTELTDEQREQAARERGDVWHARRRAEFELVCRNESDDDLRWLMEYIADEIAHHDSKSVKYPESYRYLLMARGVVGAELTRRGFADRLEHSQVA